MCGCIFCIIQPIGHSDASERPSIKFQFGIIGLSDVNQMTRLDRDQLSTRASVCRNIALLAIKRTL